MNKLENKMCDILKKCLDNYGAVGTKAEFEAEGTRTDELLRLLEIANKADAKIALKIGGCESMRDIYDSKQYGVDYIIAPMVETNYALEKYIKSIKNVYDIYERGNTQFLFNCETITTINNIDKIICFCKNNKNIIHGITFGRVDFASSKGMGRDKIETKEINDAVIQVAKKCKEIDLDFVVGGDISIDSSENLKEFKSVYMSRFETRKMIFNGDAVLLDNLNEAIKDALYFELLWLFNKREYYKGIFNEDDLRIEMLEKKFKNIKNL